MGRRRSVFLACGNQSGAQVVNLGLPSAMNTQSPDRLCCFTKTVRTLPMHRHRMQASTALTLGAVTGCLLS
jgi:hypothetical protein